MARCACGRRCQGRMCQDCEREQRVEDQADHWTAGESILAELEKQDEEETA